jgi:hypothetical protein
MISLNDKIVAYLTVNNINYLLSDFVVASQNNGPEEIIYWNTAALGTQPDQAQLDSAYVIWEGQQIQLQNTSAAQVLLSATDWTAIDSVADPAVSNPYLTNQAEFLSYRSTVRNLGVNPPTTPAVFPTQPIPTWSN